MCLDCRGGAKTAGTAVILWPSHGGDNQKWEVIYVEADNKIAELTKKTNKDVVSL